MHGSIKVPPAMQTNSKLPLMTEITSNHVHTESYKMPDFKHHMHIYIHIYILNFKPNIPYLTFSCNVYTHTYMPIWQLTWKISHNSTYLPKRATSLMWSVHKAELRQHGINFTACPLSKKDHIKAFLGHFNQVLFKIFLIILTMHDSINLQHTQWCFAPSSQSTVLASCGGRGNFTNHTSLWLTRIIPSNGADSHHLRH